MLWERIETAQVFYIWPKPTRMESVRLETERLILKGLTPEDVASVFANLPQTEIKAFLGHRTHEDYLLEQYKLQNGYAAYNRRFMMFLMTEKQSGKTIGRCSLHNWNAAHCRAEIGYNIEEDFRRKGLTGEAVRAVIGYGFDTLKLHRIEALVGAGNIASLKIMQQFGFVREGLLREHWRADGQYEDSILFSKLSSEYIPGFFTQAGSPRSAGRSFPSSARGC